MKVLYVGNILPMEIVNQLGLSVAGKKYENSLAKALDTILNGNLDIVSVTSSGRNLGNYELFAGKKYRQTVHIKLPILGDVIRTIHFFSILLWWSVLNIKQKKFVLILNSPFGVCLSALAMKVLFAVKPVSLTIDTPFTRENKYDGIMGWYNKTLFNLGHRLLKWFSGIIVLNKKVVKELNLKIPFSVSKVGFDESKYDFQKICSTISQLASRKKTIVYAGTLIYYNGISTLLKAFALLEHDEYQLHIYGYGPLENEVNKYSENHSNIFFYGRVDNTELLDKLSDADLLINPRLTCDSINDFTFPSKLTEYILSGRSVLSTRFDSLPEDYKKFLFFVDDETPQGYCEAIRRLFSEDKQKRSAMANEGVSYVRRHQNWDRIAEDMVGFFKTL